RRQLDVARSKGFEFMVGMELEYFLLRQREDGSIEIADSLDTLEKPCYDLKGLTRNYEFLGTVSRYVNELGWGNYANDHEDANGQFEQNFTFADALTSSDRGIFYRYNNRTQMFRIPGPGRIEDRSVDGSCNPYLAATAVLAAGLDGIENALDPGEPNSENLYAIPFDELTARGLRTLPSNLLEAVDELERDDVLRRALGRSRDED